MRLPHFYNIEFESGRFVAYHKGENIGNASHFAGAVAIAWKHRNAFLEMAFN